MAAMCENAPVVSARTQPHVFDPHYRAAMSRTRAKSRTGFILAEALVALAILGVVLLALEGSLTIVMRTLAESDRESIATRIAETQRERAFSTVCGNASGSDSANAVVVDWTATAASGLVHISQSSRYPRRIGTRVEHYNGIGVCQ